MPLRAPISHHLDLYPYWLAKRGSRSMLTAALGRLSAAGATVVEGPMAEFAQAAAVNPRGALTKQRFSGCPTDLSSVQR
jgi:hypothetical protein